jgi:hypothetical protein
MIHSPFARRYSVPRAAGNAVPRGATRANVGQQGVKNRTPLRAGSADEEKSMSTSYNKALFL